jgi:hypothetical protein
MKSLEIEDAEHRPGVRLALTPVPNLSPNEERSHDLAVFRRFAVLGAPCARVVVASG